MNNRNKQSNMPQRQSPTTIKISKSVLYMSLTVSIISLLISTVVLVLTLYNPVNFNKKLNNLSGQMNEKLDNLSGQMNELVRIWQSGGNVSNSTDTEQTTQNQDTIKIKPSLEDANIKQELGLIGGQLLELSNSANIKKAMNELDASAISVKGVVSNVNMTSLSTAFNEISKAKDKNIYISKIFFGTTENNFITAPETEMPKTYNPTSEQWYKLAQTSTDVQCSQIYQDEFSKEYVVTLSVVIKNDNNKELGVLGAQVNLSKIK